MKNTIIANFLHFRVIYEIFNPIFSGGGMLVLFLLHESLVIEVFICAFFSESVRPIERH